MSVNGVSSGQAPDNHTVDSGPDNHTVDVNAKEKELILKLLKEYGLANGITDEQLNQIINDLNQHLDSIADNQKTQYETIQKAYIEAVKNAKANNDQAAIDQAGKTFKEQLQNLIDGPGGFKDQFNLAIFQTLSPYLPHLTDQNDHLIDELRDEIFADYGNGSYLKNIYNFQVTDPLMPWPSEEAPPEKPPVTPPVTPPDKPKPPPPSNPFPGCVKVHITILPGQDPNDIYIRVQGKDPLTGRDCYITWDMNSNPPGKPEYHDIGDPNTSSDPSQYCIRLSDLPKSGDGVDIYLPPMDSGRLFISKDAPLYTENPDPQNPSLPDYKAKYSMAEFTNKDGHIFFDTSAVDTFSSVQMQMHSSDGAGPKIGYGGAPAEFLKNFEDQMKKFAGPNSIWDTLFTKDANGNIERVMSPKHYPDSFRSYFTDYLKNTFLPYYQQGKGDHWLYLQTGQGVLKGQVSADGKTFNFYDSEGHLVTSLPTDTNNSIAWLTGATGDWCPGQATSDTQKDLMRDLSAIINTGIRPEDLGTSWDNPIDKQYFVTHQDLFYKATNPDGSPAYNVYTRAMHESGYNGYSYDYDDLLGQDGTQVGNVNDPNLSYTISFQF
jgi:hypothetical protein